MAKKEKACKQCGFLTDEDVCPNCGSNSFSEKYKGVVVIFDVNSRVAKELNKEKPGKYALKVD